MNVKQRSQGPQRPPEETKNSLCKSLPTTHARAQNKATTPSPTHTLTQPSPTLPYQLLHLVASVSSHSEALTTGLNSVVSDSLRTATLQIMGPFLRSCSIATEQRACCLIITIITPQPITVHAMVEELRRTAARTG
jgi:hypothetical protein